MHAPNIPYNACPSGGHNPRFANMHDAQYIMKTAESIFNKLLK